MTKINAVVLVGAGGSLGSVVLEALLNAKFAVTVLSRSDSSSTFPEGVKVIKIDYSDTEGLATALKGQDAVVSTVGYAAFLEQKKLVDAAVSAGIKRFIPSEFGADPDTPARHLPVFANKVEVDKYLRSRVEGLSTTYTIICNDHFLDWDLDFGFSANLKSKTMDIFDGGDVPFTATPLPFVAQGIVKVLQNPEETANRIIRLHGTAMTQNKWLELVQSRMGREGWRLSHVDTEEREKQAWENLENDPNDWIKWAIPFLQVSIWGKQSGSDFSQRNDNQLLGLREMSDAEIEEVFRNRLG